MRYLPLTPADRTEMLGVIGAADIDALFADVPEAARLSGPIAGLSARIWVSSRSSAPCPRWRRAT